MLSSPHWRSRLSSTGCFPELGREIHAQFGEYAAQIQGVDLDTRLAELDDALSDFPGVREARNGCRAVRGMRSFWRNEPDAALAEWAAIIAEDPEGAASAHFWERR
jgi:hypothetical protein